MRIREKALLIFVAFVVATTVVVLIPEHKKVDIVISK